MLLDKNKPGEITHYLHTHKLIEADERVISAEKPGEGNMNYVLRLQLNNRTLIIKQARPYVEKYPNVAAPEERVIIEGEFYKQVAGNAALSAMMPAIIKVDEIDHILILEDLGEASDFTFLYEQEGQLSKEEAHSLTAFISKLHNSFESAEPSELLANRKLRSLNHEHIFIYPLMVDNGFDLNLIQPGLQAVSMKYKSNEQLKRKANQLGAVYLADGATLLHGDYYPGSWLKTSAGVKVIDPEFSFYGPAEYDLGVMLAHLKMAEQDDSIIQLVMAAYEKRSGFDNRLLKEFIGIEIIRRIIGLAQLPLTLTLQQKEALLEEAVGLLNLN
jgi:5-methylthioribose kinase